MQKPHKYALILMTAMVLLVGCATSSHKVNINPNLHVNKSNIGKGETILLKIVDDRADQTIGYRQSGFGKAGNITTDQNIVKIISSKIMEGLQQKGFKPVLVSKDLKRSITVEIRLIEYNGSTNGLGFTVYTKVALKVLSRNENNKYEKIYRIQNEEDFFIVPGPTTNEELINLAITQALEKFFQDEKLFTFITEEKKAK